jgi:type IV pilus assembly protein PilQ
MTIARNILPALFLAGFGGSLALFGLRADAGDATLDKVQVVAGEMPEIILHLDDAAEGSAVSTFTMSGPDRLVIDVGDTKANPEVRQVEGDGALIDRVEVVTFDEGNGMITRVTLFLNEPAGQFDTPVHFEGKQVRISMTRKATSGGDPLAEALSGDPDNGTTVSTDEGSFAAAAAPRRLSGPDDLVGGATISSIDFQNLDQWSRVVVGLSGSDDYAVSQPQGNLIVADFPGAYLPQSLTRVLDTGEFVSPVRMVRAYKTSTGTRVAISLRRDAKYKVLRGDAGLVYIDVAVPAQMQQDRDLARQDYATAAPSTPDGQVSSGTQSELMIGHDGRTRDPSATYGQGAGMNDPSSLLGMAVGFMYDGSSASSTPYSGRRISLDFVNADIHSIFRLISHVSRLNIVAGDDVQGGVTVRMTDVPWDQALAAVLQAKGLGSQRFGNIVRVAPIETIKSEQQTALEAKRAQEELTELELLVMPLNYVQATEMASQIGDLLSPRGAVQVDNTGNQLIVKETEKRLVQIRELVKHLDRQTPQVLIEARVVEANSNYSRSLGVQWGAELDATTRTGYSTGLFFPNGVGASGSIDRTGSPIFYSPGQESLLVDLGAEAATSGVSFNLGSIPGLIDLDARLSAMETDGWGKVVSQPRITTLDNQSAHISQGQRVPFLSTSAGGTSVQFIEAALEMTVTPHITSDDKVFLTLEVTNNRADFSQLVLGQPAIQVKEISTELLVGDGDTTVMGGVFSTESSFSQDRVPGLSKIPLLGYLFKNSTESVTRNEMLVFITPHIVTRAVRE